MDIQVLINFENQTIYLNIKSNFTVKKVKYLLITNLKTKNNCCLDISNIYLTYEENY